MRDRMIKKKQKFFKEDVWKVVATLFMLALIAFIASNFIRSVTVMTEKVRILEIVEDEVEQLRMDNLELILKKSEIVSYEYVEKEARDKLKYSKDEEVVFVIPEDLLMSQMLEEELMKAKGIEIEEDPKDTQDIIHIWLDFLFVSGV